MNIKIEDILEVVKRELKSNWGKILGNEIIIFLVFIAAFIVWALVSGALLGIAIGISSVSSVLGIILGLFALVIVLCSGYAVIFGMVLGHYVNAKSILENKKLISVYKEVFTKRNASFFFTNIVLKVLAIYVLFILVVALGFFINEGLGVVVAILALIGLIVAVVYVAGEFNIALYKGTDIKASYNNLKQTYTRKQIASVILVQFVLGLIVSIFGLIALLIPLLGVIIRLLISMVGSVVITMAMIVKLNEDNEQISSNQTQSSKVTLETETTTVVIDSMGAQITSVVNGDVEYMWQADPAYWGRTAPVLFPFVGKLKDDRYAAGEELIPMNQHGFLRDRNFTLINQTRNSATFEYTSTLADFELYPCDFTVQITYQINGNKITTTYNIINNSGYEMPYQIGAHPAFNVESVDDLTVVFPAQTVTQHFFTDGLQSYTETTSISDVKLSYDEINRNMPCYSNFTDHKLTLQNKGQDYIKFEFNTMDYLAIWSPEYKNANFVCIEPWNGICSRADQQGYLLENKDGTYYLAANSSHSCSYSFEIC